MSILLKGAPVSASITAANREKVLSLESRGVHPVLAIVRLGEKSGDLSYEKGAVKKCSDAGIKVRKTVLPENAGEEEVENAVSALADDPGVHGILLLRPLPRSLDEQKIVGLIPPEKDVDGCTPLSLAGVFTGSGTGFPPCTAESVIRILDYYNIGITGKKAVVIGRSLVIGRPAAMMLMQRNATVTVCHTKTADVASEAQKADILVCASGKMESIGGSYLSAGQTVIDVGIGWNEKKQKLCGDVLFEEASGIAEALTPVPGGVGAVTSAVLASHVTEAAEKSLTKEVSHH